LRTSDRPEKRGLGKQVRRLLADKLGKRFSYQRIPAKGFCAYQLSAAMPPGNPTESEMMLAASNPARLKFSNDRLGLTLQALARVWPHGHIGKCFQSEPFQL
jgi:hypothetical protein